MISVETHILHFCVLILILLEVTQIDLCSVKGFAGMTVLILILLEVTQIGLAQQANGSWIVLILILLEVTQIKS